MDMIFVLLLLENYSFKKLYYQNIKTQSNIFDKIDKKYIHGFSK